MTTLPRPARFMGLWMMAMLVLTCLSATMVSADTTPTTAWPTSGQMLGQAQAGQWLKYHMTQQSGTRQVAATLWLVHEGKQGHGHTVRLIQSAQGDTSDTPPAAGSANVQSNTLTLAENEPYQFQPLPPGTKIIQDKTERSDFNGLNVGGITCSGQKYVRQIELEAGNGFKLSCTMTMWVSDQAPLTGIVKQAMTLTGPVTATMEMTLLASHPAMAASPGKPSTPATTPIQADIRQPIDLLKLSDQLAIQGWKLDSMGHPPKSSAFSSADAFSARLAITAAQMGEYAWAMKLRDRQVKPLQKQYVTNELREVMADAGREQDLARLGVTADKILTLLVEREAARRLAQSPWDFEGYLAWVKHQDQRPLRSLAVTMALEADTPGLSLAQRRALLAALPDEADRASWLARRWAHLADQASTPQAIANLAELDPSIKSSIRLPLGQAMILQRLGQTAEAAPLVDQAVQMALGGQADAKDRPDWQVTAELQRLAKLLKARRDARYAAIERRLLTFNDANWRNTIQKYPDRPLSPYALKAMAMAFASQGNLTEATRLMSHNMDRKPYDGVELALAYARHADSPTETQKWIDAIELDKETQEKKLAFRVINLRVAVMAGLAEHAWLTGDEDSCQQLIQAAVAMSVQANTMFIEWNRQNKPPAFWSPVRLGTGPETWPPYRHVAEFLLNHPSAEHDKLLLAMLGQLKNEMPVSSRVRDLWQHAARQAAKQERRGLMLALYQVMPADWQRNWAMIVYNEATPAVAALQPDGQGNVAYVRQLTATTSVPNAQAMILRTAIVQLVQADCLQDALALWLDLRAADQNGAWGQHRSFAAVALARGHLQAKQWDAALAAFNDRTTNLEESIPIRGFNGQNWVNYLSETGATIGKLAAQPKHDFYDPYELAHQWIAAVKDHRELAALTLGMAKGYSQALRQR